MWPRNGITARVANQIKCLSKGRHQIVVAFGWHLGGVWRIMGSCSAFRRQIVNQRHIEPHRAESVNQGYVGKWPSSMSTCFVSAFRCGISRSEYGSEARSRSSEEHA